MNVKTKRRRWLLDKYFKQWQMFDGEKHKKWLKHVNSTNDVNSPVGTSHGCRVISDNACPVPTDESAPEESCEQALPKESIPTPPAADTAAAWW